MIGKVWRILFAFVVNLSVSAATTERAELFSTANKAYEKGNFAQAAALYESVITNGSPTAPAWFNLGNARFKAGELGGAIAAWRMAEFSMPRDPALRANLAFARRKISDSAAHERSVFDNLISYFTFNEWAAAAGLLWSACFAALAIAQWRRVPTRPSLLVILGCATLLTAGAAARSFFVTFRQSDAVVVNSTVTRFGPLEDSQIAFQAADGAEFRILDSTTGWVQVQDRSGKIGWVKKGDVAIVSR